MKKNFFYIFVLISLFNSCVSEFNADLPFEDLEILIVDGSIIENSDVTFYLSKSIPLNTSYSPEESLNVIADLSIIGSDGYKSLPTKYLGRGAYLFSVGELKDNVEYGIKIEYNGDIYQSDLAIPLRTPEIDSISWVQPEEKGDVFFRVSTHDDSGEAKFFIWSYTEDWEITAYFYVNFFFSPVENSFYYADPSNFYCWRKNTSNKFLIGSAESLKESRIINKQLFSCMPTDSRFSNLYSINVVQRATTKRAFEYYQNKIVLNEEMGGLFTPQPSEIMGNIVCVTDPSKRVMGFVETVKNTTQKRIFVSREKITRPFLSSHCTSITTDSLRIILDEFNGTFVDAYKLGYRPITAGMFMEPSEWSTDVCTDCTKNGGSKIKPDFWPNDHE